MFLLEKHSGNVVSPTAFIAIGTKMMIGSITITYINTLKIKSIVLVLPVRQKLVIRATADIRLVIIIVI
jgi:hypothetical protein